MSDLEAIREVVEQIRPLLAGRAPEIQGSILVDLTSMWLAGFPKEVRLLILEFHTQAIWEMTPINAELIRGECHAGH